MEIIGNRRKIRLFSGDAWLVPSQSWVSLDKWYCYANIFFFFYITIWRIAISFLEKKNYLITSLKVLYCLIVNILKTANKIVIAKKLTITKFDCLIRKKVVTTLTASGDFRGISDRGISNSISLSFQKSMYFHNQQAESAT